jgi:AcrR family transcriptional regulator
MPGVDTREKILDAAERLFGAHGFAGTSLRAVTRKAEVNLAAVHYHFGTKEDLLRAVLERVVVPVNQERLARLGEIEAGSGDEPPPVEAILEAYLTPGLRSIRDLGERGMIITRFLGRSYTEPNELVQALVREQFGEVGQRFTEALGYALPHLPETELHRRFMLVVGVMTYIQADAGRTGEYAEDLSDVEGMVGHLVAFLAAGLRAPAPALRQQVRAKEGASS